MNSSCFDLGAQPQSTVSRADARSSANAPLAINVRGLESETPVAFALEQNYPNPFNPRTVVSSQLPAASDVKLVVFDLLGGVVATLVDQRRPAGIYRDVFDGTGLASGVYYYRLHAGDFVQTRMLCLIR